jgi:hypothetical protein
MVSLDGQYRLVAHEADRRFGELRMITIAERAVVDGR